ncbi:hypothetical protein Tco_0003388 [Tanacetum coccineum]
MVWSGYAVLMSGKTDSIKLNNNPGCLPGSTFVYSEVFKLDFSSASLHRYLVKISAGFALKKDIKILARKSNRKTKISDSVPDDQYVISNGSGYVVLISLNEYAVLDRKLDTPYPMEMDTPHGYAISSLMDTAYWLSKQYAFGYADMLFKYAFGFAFGYAFKYVMRLMSAVVAQGHGGDGGGDDRPPSRPISTDCRGEVKNPTGEAEQPTRDPRGNQEPRANKNCGWTGAAERIWLSETLEARCFILVSMRLSGVNL